MKGSIIILTGVCTLIILLLFLFGWIITLVDSYFYQAFAQYIITGIYPATHPYYWATTISPPAYSLFLAALQNLPFAHHLLHGVQLIMLFITIILSFLIFTRFLKPSMAVLGSLFIMFIPGTILYTSAIMTEIPSQFLLTLFVYLIFRFIETKKLDFIFIVSILSAVMTLFKYSFVVYVFLTIAIYISNKKYWHIQSLTICILTLGILGTWIGINYRISDTVGLSDVDGIHIYDQVVWKGKILPKKSDRNLDILIKYFGPQGLFIPHWDIEAQLIKNGISWYEVDEILGSIAWQAIKSHPFRYMQNSINIWLTSFNTDPPYDLKLQSFGNESDLRCWTIGKETFCSPFYRKVFCDRKSYSNIYPCIPLIKTSLSNSIFILFVMYSTWFYKYIFPFISYWIFIPSLFIGYIWGDKYLRVIIGIYLLGSIPIAMFERPEARYVIPFYPLIIILMLVSISIISKKISKYLSIHSFRKKSSR